MKAKKGAARTRKFSSGGDIAAGLVGLGTLGYLLSKKKDKEKEDAGNMSSIGEKSDVAEKILSRSASSAAESAEDRQKKANMGEPEESDIQKAVGKPLPSTTSAERAERAEPVKPVSKPVIKSAKPVSATSKSAAPDLKPGESKVVGEGRLKPYPKDAKPAESKPYPKDVKKPEEKKATPASSKTVAKGIKQLSEDSPAAKALREQRKQRLGANYAAQKRALDTAPEGPGKEALKKSVEKARRDYESSPMKRGGMVKKYASGGSVKSSASKRADGIAQRGKTRGRIY